MKKCYHFKCKNDRSVSWEPGMSNVVHIRFLLGSARISRARSSVMDLPLNFWVGEKTDTVNIIFIKMWLLTVKTFNNYIELEILDAFLFLWIMMKFFPLLVSIYQLHFSQYHLVSY